MARKWFNVTEKGSLLEFGYSPKKSEEARHRAIKQAIDSPKHSAVEVFRKLQGLSNVTQTSQPANSEIYRRDADWVSNNFL